MQKMMIAGVYVWGALYTAGVFIAALTWGDRRVVLLSLLSAGFAYLSQSAGAYATGEQPSMKAWYMNLGFMAASVLFGAVAGITLILAA